LDQPVIRALLVDDDQGDYQMTRAILEQVESPRIELDWVSTFEEGCDALQADEYDVYIVDYFLEDRTGIDLLKEAGRRRLSAPVIMLTGRGSHDVDIEAMRAGAADYLVKGQIDPQTMERSIRYALERSRAQRALRDSEERHRSMFDHLPIGLYRCSPEGGFLDANPALVRILGYPDPQTLESVYARNLYVNPENVPSFREQLETYGVVRGFQTQLRRLDGSTIWVRNTARAHRDPDGNIAYIEGAVEDASDLHRVAMLHDDAARFRAMFEHGLAGIALVDPDGLIIEANGALAHASGWGVDELVGSMFVDLVAEDDREAVNTQLMDALTREAVQPRGERRLVARDDTVYWANLSVVPVRDWQGEVSHLLVLAEDLADAADA